MSASPQQKSTLRQCFGRRTGLNIIGGGAGLENGQAPASHSTRAFCLTTFVLLIIMHKMWRQHTDRYHWLFCLRWALTYSL